MCGENDFTQSAHIFLFLAQVHELADLLGPFDDSRLAGPAHTVDSAVGSADMPELLFPENAEAVLGHFDGAESSVAAEVVSAESEHTSIPHGVIVRIRCRVSCFTLILLLNLAADVDCIAHGQFACIG